MLRSALSLLLSALWYATLAAGAWHVFMHGRAAARDRDVRTQARRAARGFGVAGLVLWAYFFLDEARRTVGYDPTQVGIMGWLGLLGTALISAVLLLVPFWMPHFLLRGEPGPLRRGLVALIAWAVLLFAVACMLIAPVMTLFASSFGEWLRTVVTIALPLAVLAFVAKILARSVVRVGAFE
jgi:hypothetical protein